jgi:hypothetical protein
MKEATLEKEGRDEGPHQLLPFKVGDSVSKNKNSTEK